MPSSSPPTSGGRAGAAAAAQPSVMSRLPCRADAIAALLFIAHFIILYPSLSAAPPLPAGPSSPLLNAAVAASSLAGLAWAALLWSIARSSRPSMPLSSPLLLSALAAGGLLSILAIITAVRSSLLLGLAVVAVVLGDAAWVRRARGRMTAAMETIGLVGRLIEAGDEGEGGGTSSSSSSSYPSGSGPHAAWWRRPVTRLAIVIIAASALQAGFLVLWSSSIAPLLALQSGGEVVAVLLAFASFRWVTATLKHCLTVVITSYVTAAIKRAVLQHADAAAGRHAAFDDADAAAMPVPSGGAEVALSIEAEAHARAMGAADAVLTTPTRAGRASAGDVVTGKGDAVSAAAAEERVGLTAAFDEAADRGDGRGISSAAASSAAAAAGGRVASSASVSPRLPPRTPEELRSHVLTRLGKHATFDAFAASRAAVTTALGSIVTGAALGLCAPLAWPCRRGARYAARHAGASTGGRLLASTAASLYGACEAYLRCSHKYAYVMVATHGSAWWDAALETWDLFHARGVDAVIDDDVTDRLLLFGGYVGGAFLSLVLATTTAAHAWLLTSVAVFCAGFVGVTLPLTVYEASVSALLVTYAAVPEAVTVIHPVLAHRYSRLSEVYLMARAHSRVARISAGEDEL